MALRFCWLLPLVWGAGCVLGFQSPGDEYFLFAIGSIAGVWAAIFLSGDVQGMLLPILLAGCLLMAGLGLVLDRLRASPRLWWTIWAVATAALYFVTVGQYPTTEAAVAKNGSLLAYWIAASQLAVYLASAVALVVAALRAYAGMVRQDLGGQTPR